jgi:ribosomal protein S18 acetylase RimI-like enzyme
MFNVRRFVAGIDEPVWVGILNASRKGREDWRPITAEEMLLQEKENPSFDVQGRFIAELDGQPVGTVGANVEKQRKERKGFIRFDVIPECRGRGIERRLVETGLRELEARGMAVAQAPVDSRELEYVTLLEELGFSRVRVFSNMQMETANISRGIGENGQVAIRPLHKNQEEDIELFTWLLNETFKEHFNFRPDTVEEIRYFLSSAPYFNKYKQVFFAVAGDETVGYVGVGIDERYNLERNVESGEIFTIGVLKKHRRTGIGVRLILHALEILKAEGMTIARLGVDDFNPTKAIRVYEKAGFKVTKKDLIFEREL